MLLNGVLQKRAHREKIRTFYCNAEGKLEADPRLAIVLRHRFVADVIAQEVSYTTLSL